MGYTVSTSGITNSRDMYNHRDTGVYHVQVYLVNQENKMHFLKASSFTVDTLPEESIDITNVNESNGMFDVNVHFFRDLSTVDQVYVKTLRGQMGLVAANSVQLQLVELPPKVEPHTISNFPIIYQNPELPTGCEVVALTMVLHEWMG